MRNRNIQLVVLSSLFIVSGCTGPGDASTGPGTPQAFGAHAAPAPPPQSIPNWKANVTVVSVARGSTAPCGSGTSVGETESPVGWRITTTADSISLDEDTHSWPSDDIPYSGQLDGTKFAASYTSDSDYANYVCEFREGSLTGQFTSDSTFDAVETLIWGKPGTETTVTRRWHGSRLIG
jgi:hypothetical protein